MRGHTKGMLPLTLVALVGPVHAASQATISPGFNGEFIVTLDHDGPIEEGHLSMMIDNGVRIPATTIEDVKQPIAIAIVMNTLRDMPSELRSLRSALDSSGLKTAGPDGSSCVVIGYDRDVTLLQPRRRLADFDARELYLGEDRPKGDALLAGMAVGIEILSADQAPRKALIVIGLGTDTQFPIDHQLLHERAREQHIQVASLERDISGPFSMSPSELTSALRHITTMLPRQSKMTFHPGLLRWDGRPHRFEIWRDNALLSRTDVNLPLASGAPVQQPIFESWMAAAVAGIGLGAIVAALALIWRRRSAGQLSI